MKLFVRTPERKEYQRQLYSLPPILPETKPGDTIYSLTADYHIEKIEYSKSELIVHATKTQVTSARRD